MAESVGIRMSKRSVWTLVLLVLMSVFLLADQNAINPVIQELVQEYGVAEDAIGLAGSAFFILGAIISLMFGYFTDRFSRKWLLALVVLIGEIPCFLTGIRFFTQTYESFLFLRILTGIGVGGIFPLTYSLIGDYFSREHRTVVNAWVGLAWGIGMFVGQAVAGFLVTQYGWRPAFMLVAAPNFILVPLFLLVAKDPVRGQAEAAVSSSLTPGSEYLEKIQLRDLKLIFANKTNLLAFLQGVPGCIPWGVLPFFLIQFYRVEKGFPVDIATTLTLAFGAGALIGGVAGGYIGQALYKKDMRYLPIFGGAMVLLGAVPWFILLALRFPANPGWPEFPLPASIGFIAGFIATLPGANIKTILLNVNRPQHRGTVFAVFNLTDNLGKGIGPYLGGLLISTLSYPLAMNLSVAGWIPCGIIFMMIAMTFVKDTQRLDNYLNERTSSAGTLTV